MACFGDACKVRLPATGEHAVLVAGDGLVPLTAAETFSWFVFFLSDLCAGATIATFGLKRALLVGWADVVLFDVLALLELPRMIKVLSMQYLCRHCCEMYNVKALIHTVFIYAIVLHPCERIYKPLFSKTSPPIVGRNRLFMSTASVKRSA